MKKTFQYAAKVVLGKSDGRVVAPGEYWTAVNVHNPSYRQVDFRKKVAIGLPAEKAGPVSKWFSAKLKADEALEIDRDDIFRHADAKDFLKGFVVIESAFELDVVSVYTVADKQGSVCSIHTERVPARTVIMDEPDLVPKPDEKGSFCRRDARGNLIVTVYNQGLGASNACKTAVDFGRWGTVVLPTPALASGASVDLLFPIPRGCFDSDCEFTIVVDSANEAMESNEGNNKASGNCIG